MNLTKSVHVKLSTFRFHEESPVHPFGGFRRPNLLSPPTALQLQGPERPVRRLTDKCPWSAHAWQFGLCFRQKLPLISTSEESK